MLINEKKPKYNRVKQQKSMVPLVFDSPWNICTLSAFCIVMKELA